MRSQSVQPHVLRGLASHGMPQRDVLVYVPRGGAGGESAPLPVLYMHDGEKLFSGNPARATGWDVDGAVEDAAARGLGRVVVVAVTSGTEQRIREYSPWPEARVNGHRPEAEAYLDFLAATVRPAVESAVDVRSDPAGVGISGSSLGGLVSLYAVMTRPYEYGFCGALSPALHFGGERIFPLAEEEAGPGLRVHLDVGGREGLPELEENGETNYVNAVRRMRDLLIGAGAEVTFVEDPEGAHDETAWRARIPEMLEHFIRFAAR